jgi:guanosine-3',5'-bis(diphosphate) 3'-pyrophosphohydrolase
MAYNSTACHAMRFAQWAHRDQVRKYTGNPYTDHLAEVAGIVATVDSSQEAIATAWLHDCFEDAECDLHEIEILFGGAVLQGVTLLSDLEKGNRYERKAASRLRLSGAPSWIQTIKVADLISNTPSIVKHDPKFAVTYLKEMEELLDVLKRADNELLALAWDIWRGSV